MLNEKEKERLRAEEIFRAEVQKELAHQIPPSTKVKAVWVFLNSSLSICLLSSFVLGLITWSYTRWREQHTVQRNRIEKINRLDTEIRNRLDLVQLQIRVNYDEKYAAEMPQRVLLDPVRKVHLFQNSHT